MSAIRRPVRLDVRALSLGLLVCAFAQLVIAGHQFQHDDGAGADVCAICIQVDQFDAPPAELMNRVATGSPTEPALSVPGDEASAPAIRNYEPRAPPAR